jgi:hypothetical protein
MLTAIVLTALAIMFRMFSASFQVWNLVPMGAISLYAGARLPRRWAWAVPLCAMVLSDLMLESGRNPFYVWTTRLVVYGAFAAITLLGPLANRPKIGRWLLPVLAAGGSVFFFVTTNFAVWTEGVHYPLTAAGLLDCYVKGLMMLRNTVVADLIGTAVLFGIGPVWERAWLRLARPRLAKIPVEVHSPAVSERSA